MKRAISLLQAAALACCLCTGAFAASEEAMYAAGVLNDLGLFGGVGANADGSPNYDLDRPMTRAEAVTMLVRLLGKEEAAQTGTWDLPFRDVPDWAAPYVGYACFRGLTNGVDEGLFGSDTRVSATQYLTFLLRALGYSSDADFKWNEAWTLTDRLGITAGQYGSSSGFLRSDAVLVSRNALLAQVKGTERTLLSTLKLKTDERKADIAKRLYPPAPDSPEDPGLG